MNKNTWRDHTCLNCRYWCTGYVGTEIVRLLSQHPDVEITALFQRVLLAVSFQRFIQTIKHYRYGINGYRYRHCAKKVIFSLLLYLMKHQDIIPELIKGGKRVLIIALHFVLGKK